MSYDGKPITLDRQTVVDDAYIENVNWAFVGALESEHDMFGKEFVLEDGKVTEVHTQFKIVIGVGKMVITTGEVMDIVDKLNAVSDAFCQLAIGCDDSDFALKDYYSKAANTFKEAADKVNACLRYCPKKRHVMRQEGTDEKDGIRDEDGARDAEDA